MRIPVILQSSCHNVLLDEDVHRVNQTNNHNIFHVCNMFQFRKHTCTTIYESVVISNFDCHCLLNVVWGYSTLIETDFNSTIGLVFYDITILCFNSVG